MPFLNKRSVCSKLISFFQKLTTIRFIKMEYPIEVASSGSIKKDEFPL
jgi:hypothetical protein